MGWMMDAVPERLYVPVIGFQRSLYSRQQFPPGRNPLSKSPRPGAPEAEISPESHDGTASRGASGNDCIRAIKAGPVDCIRRTPPVGPVVSFRRAIAGAAHQGFPLRARHTGKRRITPDDVSAWMRPQTKRWRAGPLRESGRRSPRCWSATTTGSTGSASACSETPTRRRIWPRTCAPACLPGSRPTGATAGSPPGSTGSWSTPRAMHCAARPRERAANEPMPSSTL